MDMNTKAFTLSHSAKKGKLDSVNAGTESTGVKGKDIGNSESTERYVI